MCAAAAPGGRGPASMARGLLLELMHGGYSKDKLDARQKVQLYQEPISKCRLGHACVGCVQVKIRAVGREVLAKDVCELVLAQCRKGADERGGRALRDLSAPVNTACECRTADDWGESRKTFLLSCTAACECRCISWHNLKGGKASSKRPWALGTSFGTHGQPGMQRSHPCPRMCPRCVRMGRGVRACPCVRVCLEMKEGLISCTRPLTATLLCCRS
eukprot:scaffold50821_cov21-Tisochrysis_lutea.AAC.1